MALFHRRAARDPVGDQLRDIARQGTAMARVAHVFAFLLIVLFSLASLVALTGDALRHFISSWQSGQLDIPSGISIVVSTLLVPTMDFSMFYAAMIIRNLRARRAGKGEQLIHWLVIAVVIVAEGSTYIYMAALYEQPHTFAEWAIIVFRGGTASMLSVYLAMARALPVTARDILALAELGVGTGVARDVTVIANDGGASLADKMMLYDASAVMRPEDRARLTNMIGVARVVASRDTDKNLIAAHATSTDTQAFERENVTSSNAPGPLEPEDNQEGEQPPETDPTPPRPQRRVNPESNGHDANSSSVRTQPANSRLAAASTRRPGTPGGRQTKRPTRSDTGMSQEERERLRDRRLAAAERILKDDPRISVDVLAKRIAIATQHRISESTAHGLMTEIQGRKPKSRSADAAQQAAEANQ